MDNEILTLENEIRSLQIDISLLQADYNSLLRQKAQVEAEIGTTKTTIPVIPIRSQGLEKVVVPNDHDDTPPLYHYNFFDESIQKYFKESPKKNSIKGQFPSLFHKLLAQVEYSPIHETAFLTETIHRFGGITAFPINDWFYDSEDCLLLGVRFDTMNHTTGQFLKPAFIILRQKKYSKIDAVKFSPWSIFRYTTPDYVALDKHSKLLLHHNPDTGLADFVEKIRLILVKVEYRHEIINKMKAMSFKSVLGDSTEDLIASVEADPACSRLSFNLSNNHAIQINFDDEFVSEVLLSPSLSPHGRMVQSILHHLEFSGILSRMGIVYQFLRGKNVI